MSENKLSITDKDLQEIGLKLVEAAPTAKTVMVWVSGDKVYLTSTYNDGSGRDADVPLLKEVNG